MLSQSYKVQAINRWYKRSDFKENDEIPYTGKITVFGVIMT